MIRMLALVPAAAALLAVSVVSVHAAGPYDGTWEFSAPAAKAIANATNPQGCEPVKVRMVVKDNQVTGSLARSALGRAVVENSTSPKATPVEGTISPDGAVRARWQNIDVTGTLKGSPQIRWNADCGPRVATGKKIG